jgi:hypothetical protein
VCANVNVLLSFAVARIGRLLDTGLVVFPHFDGPSHVSEVVGGEELVGVLLL